MLRTILQLWATSPGFDAHHVLAMTVAIPPANTKNTALIRNAWQQALDRVRDSPGVEAAALDGFIPLSGDYQAIQYWSGPAGQPPRNAPNAFLFMPTPDYLRAMKIPLLYGRFFTERDRLGSAPVIDETLAKKLFPRTAAVGNELSLQFIGTARIIGVVGNTKHRSLDENAYAAPQPALYISFLQVPDAFMPLTTTGMSLLVRTSVSPASVLNAVKKVSSGRLGTLPCEML